MDSDLDEGDGGGAKSIWVSSSVSRSIANPQHENFLHLDL
jgi:hypothetical protein